MPRKTKSGIDYWLENCFRCTNMTRSHYMHNGVDDGSVSLKCSLTGEYVTPWDIDGCKKFAYGAPEEIVVEIKENDNDKKKEHT